MADHLARADRIRQTLATQYLGGASRRQTGLGLSQIDDWVQQYQRGLISDDAFEQYLSSFEASD